VSHGHEHKHHFPLLRLGPDADRCEVISDARIVHPHGTGRGHAGHSHGHAAAREHDRRRLAITLGLTGAILVAEVVGGLISGSLALLSDAGHMLTDLSAQALSLLALLFASRPANARRTFGYYRLEILAALLNGMLLAVLAAYILWQAWQRIGSPPEVRTGIMITIASIGLVANLISAWLLSRAESLNVRAAYTHIVSDALASVAVLVGGVIMLAFGGLYIIDPILGFVIGLVVVLSAYRLIREAVDVLLEAVPADIDLERVRQDVRKVDGIEDVHDLHIWTITSGLHALSAHLVVRKETLGPGIDDLLTRVKELLLRDHRIAHSTLQIESTEYTHVSHVH
jgi:cobalt-zinc-cadmium efflux system protein